MAPSPISVGVSGCGAVTALYHAPALRLLELEGAVQVTVVFDPDSAALAEVGGRFPRARRVGRFEDLLSPSPSLVLIASPPAFHAEQASAALRAGSDVLCEKPLATGLADARDLVELARQSGRILAAGMVRRYFPATRAIGETLRSGAIGTVRQFRCFEGGPFDWPVRSPAYFTKNDSGGGVLMDVGVHALDLIGWWLGPCTAMSYADDAMGGVEAECLLKLAFGEVEGEVRLSRIWPRPNRYELIGTTGSVSWTVNEADRIELRIGDGLHTLDAAIREDGRLASSFHQSVLDQLRAVTTAVAGRPAQFVSGADALPSLELIERCYRERGLMPMGWLGPEEQCAARRLAGMAG